jgi:hypothetical protein
MALEHNLTALDLNGTGDDDPCHLGEILDDHKRDVKEKVMATDNSRKSSRNGDLRRIPSSGRLASRPNPTTLAA